MKIMDLSTTTTTYDSGSEQQWFPKLKNHIHFQS